ncbi:ChaN family lipoprotein [Roseobacter sinensis]|uniref:ChaN family lipoprotein n=1 Tax=Roseobacter sinensis TaxID=2931391 RepID=A0ABT3BCX9_9RHOB|nr:ChaN family lipoprotein [Roseobacter sp. WL0113]MCV3271429.1 ChaN family lipoprotein [Roseobacter sp. WL0113]
MTLFGAAIWAASFASADDMPPEAAQTADVLFIGEQHDNPAHHTLQAAWTRALAPTALVFEMLTPDQAARITPQLRRSESDLEAALEWEASGWPDFGMYYPIFAAAPDAQIFGAAVPRDQIRGLMQDALVDIFGAADAVRFGLDQPLPAAQQATRKEMQAEAHCNALPDEMLPVMVSVQRLRDAALARAALAAVSATGGPVVVITGNGHARADWGAPVYLETAAPDLAIFALGQGEDGSTPPGRFDVTVDGPPVDRGNPCDAFN